MADANPKKKRRVRPSQADCPPLRPTFQKDDVCNNLDEVFLKAVKYHHHIEAAKTQSSFPPRSLKFLKKLDSSLRLATEMPDNDTVRKIYIDHYYNDCLVKLRDQFIRNFDPKEQGVFLILTKHESAVQKFTISLCKNDASLVVLGSDKAFKWAASVYFDEYWPKDTLRPDNQDLWEEVDCELRRKVQGPKDPMSNFFLMKGKVLIKGEWYDSVEHGYQFLKLLFFHAPPEICQRVASCETASDAKVTAKRWLKENRPRKFFLDEWRQWEEDVIALMEDLEECKYQRCLVFRDHLMYTRSCRIVHTVSDDFWGTGGSVDGNGADMFGTLLMKFLDDKLNPNNNRSWVRPTYHQRGGSPEEKIANWNIPMPFPVPNGLVIAIGDSNLAKIPPFLLENCQVESFPGCTVEILFRVVNKLQQLSLAHFSIILQIGINDLGPWLDKQSLQQSVDNLISALLDKFPNCKVYIVPLQAHHTKDPKIVNDAFSRVVAARFNNVQFLAPLPDARFRLKGDVHWKASTAKAMMQGWLYCINRQ